jgi:hypothetical protein
VEFWPQLFQGVGWGLTLKPGALIHGSLPMPCQFGPKLPKQFAVLAWFEDLARTLLKTRHLSRPRGFVTFSLLPARYFREAPLERCLSSSHFLKFSLSFRLLLTGGFLQGLMGAAVRPFSILALSTALG